MMRAHRRNRSGLTMVELFIVLAIVTILLGLLFWGISKTRAAANQITCINNMRQIGLAVQAFHENNGKFPTYNGIFPSMGDTSQAGNRGAVYGSYLVHLLPYLDKPTEYKKLMAEVGQYTNTGKPLTTAPSTPGTPAIPGVILFRPGSRPWRIVYDTTGLTVLSGPCHLQLVEFGQGRQGRFRSLADQSERRDDLGGTNRQWTPPQYADAGTTPGWYDASGNLHPTSTLPVKTAGTPGVAAVYNPAPVQAGPPIPGRSTYTSTFKTENRGLTHSVLLCPSDPSPGTDPNAPSVGVLYPTNGGKDYWSSTNYVANWNTLSVPDRTLGFKAPPQDKTAITDGLSNTILLAEAYAYCDGIGRTAYVAWHENDPTANVPNGGLTITVGGANVGGTHNFGLTYALAHDQIQAGNRPPIAVITPERLCESVRLAGADLRVPGDAAHAASFAAVQPASNAATP